MGTRVAATAAQPQTRAMVGTPVTERVSEGRDGPAEPVGPTNEPPAVDAITAETPRVIPVIAETLEIGRRELQGAVRIRKVVQENPITVDETLRDERVTVERVAIGRRLDGPVGVRHEGDVMIIPVVEERLVVEKRLVLVEEIRVRRESVARREPQHVTLRQEQILVERLDPRTQTWSAVETTPADASSEPDDLLAD
jgi:uncharacterized protein (TIGR02271 family)